MPSTDTAKVLHESINQRRVRELKITPNDNIWELVCQVALDRVYEKVALRLGMKPNATRASIDQEFLETPICLKTSNRPPSITAEEGHEIARKEVLRDLKLPTELVESESLHSIERMRSGRLQEDLLSSKSWEQILAEMPLTFGDWVDVRLKT